MNSLNRDGEALTEKVTRLVEEYADNWEDWCCLNDRLLELLKQEIEKVQTETIKKCLKALPKKKHFYIMFHRYNQYPTGEPNDVLTNWYNIGHDEAIKKSKQLLKQLKTK